MDEMAKGEQLSSQFGDKVMKFCEFIKARENIHQNIERESGSCMEGTRIKEACKRLVGSKPNNASDSPSKPKMNQSNNKLMNVVKAYPWMKTVSEVTRKKQMAPSTAEGVNLKARTWKS